MCAFDMKQKASEWATTKSEENSNSFHRTTTTTTTNYFSSQQSESREKLAFAYFIILTFTLKS